jgi:hypothetical protein
VISGLPAPLDAVDDELVVGGTDRVRLELVHAFGVTRAHISCIRIVSTSRDRDTPPPALVVAEKAVKSSSLSLTEHRAQAGIRTAF